jgi:uncharacterized membrane protein YeaQ/YmgE (transglycosylase-associated protein family)
VGLGVILSVVLAGFLIGSLARLALPGPDPMPFWLTVAIGFAGSLGGGGIAAGLFGAKHAFDSSGHAFVTLLLEVLIATALVAGYRRYVQGRPISGPGARRFPDRGVGVKRMRERLRQFGIDPDKLQTGGRTSQGTSLSPDEVAEELEKLSDRRDRGELSDDEYEQARSRLRRY